MQSLVPCLHFGSPGCSLISECSAKYAAADKKLKAEGTIASLILLEGDRCTRVSALRSQFQTMKKLRRHELGEAMDWVSGCMPTSPVMSQWLKVNFDRPGGFGTSERSACYVDHWPRSHIIAGVDFIKSYGIDNYPKFCLFTDYQGSCSENVERFLMELSDGIGVGRVGGCEAKGVSADLQPVLQKVLAGRLDLKTSISSWPCRGYWLPEEERNRLLQHSIEPPFGFQFGALKLRDADFVDSTWPLRVEGSSLTLIERQIRDFPSVCLTQTDEEHRLACFELVEAEVGLLSHLYTVLEFRRRGLAKAVETRLAQLLIDKGHVPVKAVLYGNDAAERMTTACPMWKYFGDIVWLRYGNTDMATRYAAVADNHSSDKNSFH